MKKKYELKISGLTQQGFIRLMKSIDQLNTVTAFNFSDRENSFIRFETYDIEYELKGLTNNVD